MFVSIITPVFNGGKTIYRLYMSLLKQDFTDFEWIIVNDGSTDDTADIVEKIINENKLSVTTICTNNNGKHIAFNYGLDLAKGDFILNVDADDALMHYSLSTLNYYWELVDNKSKYAGIKSQTVSIKDGMYCLNGTHFPKNKLFLDTTLYNFKFKIKLDKGEMHFLLKTEIAKKFKNPLIEGLRFYPEIISQLDISGEYLIRFLDIPTRIYYTSDSHLTSNKYNRCKENYYLWLYNLNNIEKLFIRNFVLYVKSCIGLSRDSLYSKKRRFDTIKRIKTFFGKMCYFIFYPIGWILYVLKK